MSRDALIVGINTYQHLPSLRAPANDAESVARCLESFGECRVLRMPEAIRQKKPTISPQAAVTTKMLEEALIRLFKPTGKNIPQTALFYYSGHGLQRNAGIQEGYLATSEANPTAGHYGLSMYWLRRLLQESPVRQRIIILDCCNSGEFLNVLEADPGARSGTDRLFMAASREYEEAYESLEGQHSVFTQALLSGLNPYKVKGGVVNGHSLTHTINRQLKGELQQPLFESSGGEIILTRLSGTPPVIQASKATTLDRLKHLSYGFCPFQGQASFESSHASLFFGREGITSALLDRVRQERFCALVGPSGCGKTSILQAGLVPSLQRQRQVDQAPLWDVRYLTPGHSPLKALAEIFVDSGVKGIQRAEQMRQAESFLHRGGEGMIQLVQAIAQPDSTQPHRTPQVVLIVDQFEDLLRPPAHPGLDEEQRAVLDCLMAAIQQPHLPIHVVIGLRANHLRDLQRFPEVYALVSEHGLTVPAMTYDQVKSTIVGPLEKVGLHYDANLIYTLLLDVVGAAGDLALLQTALKAVWQHREMDLKGQDPPRLTLEAYAEMGGIRHLLSQRASQFYQQLSRTDQPIAERIFMGLCELGEGSTLTRRQVQLSELVTAAMDEGQVLAVLDQMMEAGLVVAQTNLSRHDLPGEVSAAALVPATGLTADVMPIPAEPRPLAQVLARHHHDNTCQCPDLIPHFDVAHESLIRTWLPMQAWFQNSQPRLKAQRAIEGAAQEWYRQQCPNHPEYFLTKTRLQEAKALQMEYPGCLSIRATGYLQACQHYARHCARKRYLMKLLIPISMGTGMLAAYAHNVMTSPASAWKQSHPNPPAVATGPVFRSVEATPHVAASAPTGTLAMPSPPPQVGMVRTSLIETLLEGVTAPSPNAMTSLSSLSPRLPNLLQQASQRSSPWEARARTLRTPDPTLGLPTPAATAPIPTATASPEKVAEWISPADPNVMVQVWCLQSDAEPICFTLQHPLN
jgi:hypothetical protein